MKLNSWQRRLVARAKIGHTPEYIRMEAQRKAVIRTKAHHRLGSHSALTVDKATGILFHSIAYKPARRSPTGLKGLHVIKNATAKAFDKARTNFK